ncbi:MAG: CPBP family intramembrane glutamic endopeptidase, partial [Tepidisphaerales bacterium]
FIPGLGRWPWYFLVPLLIYAAVVSLIAPMRRTVHWCKPGRLTGWPLAATAAIIVGSTLTLLTFHAIVKPDVTSLARQLPLHLPVHVAFACAAFALVNALMEEVIFRGVLLDALVSQIGVAWALVIQAVAFGIGHAQGYPPGRTGMFLAGVYGLALGVLRLKSGGLLGVWIAHIAADVTIFWIVVNTVA